MFCFFEFFCHGRRIETGVEHHTVGHFPGRCYAHVAKFIEGSAIERYRGISFQCFGKKSGSCRKQFGMVVIMLGHEIDGVSGEGFPAPNFDGSFVAGSSGYYFTKLGDVLEREWVVHIISHFLKRKGPEKICFVGYQVVVAVEVAPANVLRLCLIVPISVFVKLNLGFGKGALTD